VWVVEGQSNRGYKLTKTQTRHDATRHDGHSRKSAADRRTVSAVLTSLRTKAWLRDAVVSSPLDNSTTTRTRALFVSIRSVISAFSPHSLTPSRISTTDCPSLTLSRMRNCNKTCNIGPLPRTVDNHNIGYELLMIDPQHGFLMETLREWKPTTFPFMYSWKLLASGSLSISPRLVVFAVTAGAVLW